MRNVSHISLFMTALVVLSGCGGGGGSGNGAGSGTGSGTGSGPGPTATKFSIAGPGIGGEGVAFNFTVTALDTAGGTMTGYAGTVHFASSDSAAVLPANGTLTNGVGTFTATFGNAGFQTITVTDSAAATVNGSLSVTAVAGAFPVTSFGAKGDGRTDDTMAIQRAINAAASGGGGSVVFPVARYYTTGTFVVPAGVVLCGAVEGPFDVAGVNPATTSIAPTLLVTSTAGPFLTLQGNGASVTDLLFHYPNQVASSATAPHVYPYTIVMTAPGTKVARSTVTNAFNFLDIEIGRVIVEDMFIGAFNTGTNVANVADHITLRNLLNQVFWDVLENAAYPRPIDAWVLSHGSGLVVGEADLQLNDFFVFSRYAGIVLNVACSGGGMGSDIDLDTVQYGIIVATACPGPGFEFTNVVIGAAPGLGKAAVKVPAGGALPPKLAIISGSQRGTWAQGSYPPAAPDTFVVNILP